MYKIKVTVVITIFNASVNVEDARESDRTARRPDQGWGIFFHVHCMLHNCRSIDLLTFRIDYHMGRSAKAAAALFHLYRGRWWWWCVVVVVGAGFLDQTSSLISSSDARDGGDGAWLGGLVSNSGRSLPSTDSLAIARVLQIGTPNYYSPHHPTDRRVN